MIKNVLKERTEKGDYIYSVGISNPEQDYQSAKSETQQEIMNLLKLRGRLILETPARHKKMTEEICNDLKKFEYVRDFKVLENENKKIFKKACPKCASANLAVKEMQDNYGKLMSFIVCNDNCGWSVKETIILFRYELKLSGRLGGWA